MPLPAVGLEMVYADDDFVRNLPHDQQLPPGPADGRARGILTLFRHQLGKTDKEGTFEFYTIPGRHYISAHLGGQSVVEHFTVTDKPDKDLILHSILVPGQTRNITVRTILASAPEQPVPDVTIEGDLIDYKVSGGPIEGASDARGTLQFAQQPGDYVLFAISRDRKLGAILPPINPDQNPVTLLLFPTAAVSARLVDPAGNPQPNRPIVWYTTMMYPDGHGISMYRNVVGGTTKTDGDGKFTVDGLLPGRKYEIHTGTYDPFKNVDPQHLLKTITPASADPQSLGDLSAPTTPTTRPATRPGL